MPFVLGGGETTIAGHGVAHHITFSIDPVRREPKIERVQKPASIHSGTSVTVHWPNSAKPMPKRKLYR